MALWLDNCRFRPTAGGTGDWTYSSTVAGALSPAGANAVDGGTYRYSAFSADLSQFEIGYGAYNSSTGTFARTAVLFNSAGTTAKINFSTTPIVSIVPLAEDFRPKLDGAVTLYVGANIGAVAISIATPAVATKTNHGLQANDPVVFQVPQNENLCTISAANPGVVTLANNFAAGQPISFISSGSLPFNIVPAQVYYVIATGLSGSSFQFSATVGGAAIDTSAPTATFSNGSQTITIGGNHNLAVGQVVQFAGTSVVNFSNATNYYVRSVPSATQITVSATQDGTAITAGAVTSNGTLVQAGTHLCRTVGSLPTGVTEGNVYYVLATGLTANNFQFSATQGGAAINTTGSVTGSPVYSAYTGNNNNSGLSATRSGALLTIQKALDILQASDLSIYQATVQVSDGVFTAGFSLSAAWIGALPVILQGNTTVPSNCFVNCPTGDAFFAEGDASITVLGFKISCAAGRGLYASRGGTLRITGIMDMGVFSTANHFQVLCIDGGRIQWSGTGHRITGGATSAYSISGAGASIRGQGFGTVTIFGNPTFTGYFINCNTVASSILNGNTYFGGVVATRFNVSANAVINVAGAGINYFPGTTAGVQPSGGQYV